MQSATPPGARQDLAGVSDLVVGVPRQHRPTRTPDVETLTLAGVPHESESSSPARISCSRARLSRPPACCWTAGPAATRRLATAGARSSASCCRVICARPGPPVRGRWSMAFAPYVRPGGADRAAAIWRRRSAATRSGRDLCGSAAAQEHVIMGAWLLNMGQRKAPERIAHLFCELATRMRKRGPAPKDGGYEAPLTQTGPRRRAGPHQRPRQSRAAKASGARIHRLPPRRAVDPRRGRAVRLRRVQGRLSHPLRVRRTREPILFRQVERTGFARSPPGSRLFSAATFGRS